MLYSLIFDDDARFEVEFDEEPVGPKSITARAAYFTVVHLQRRAHEPVQLQDEKGLCPWAPISIGTTDLERISVEARSTVQETAELGAAV